MKRIVKFTVAALSPLLLLVMLTAFPTVSQAQRGISVTAAKPIDSERRVALVIGNSHYKNNPLRNPVHDAQAMSRALSSLGFEVIKGEDLTKGEMQKAVLKFAQKLRGSGVGLFYYAGHGVQVNGRNYLIPIGAEIPSQAFVQVSAPDLNWVNAAITDARNRLNIIVLDACRDNPLPKSVRSESKGLAATPAPKGTLIAYATAPGSTAADGSGSNGLYTSQLLKYMQTPGIPVERVFKKVRQSVNQLSGGKQIPWEHSSIMGDFYFKPVNPQQPVKLAGGPGTTPEAKQPLPPPAPPKAPNIDELAALKEEAKRKAAWDTWQKRMGVYWETLEQLDGSSLSAQKKAKAWRAALSKFGDDNPFSYEDEALRRYANSRVSHWDGQAAENSHANKEAKANDALRKERQRKEAEAKFQKETTPDGGKRFTNSIGMTFVRIPSGSFMMGSKLRIEELASRYGLEERFFKSEYPRHRVTISKAFYMQTTEVTQAQWKAVMGNNPSWFKGCGEDCPVERVGWEQTQKFINKLNKKENTKKYRLPTEAEWEYSARANSKSAVYNGDFKILGKSNAPTLDPIAWYLGNSCINYSGGFDCSENPERQKQCSRCGTHKVAQKRPNAWGLYDMLGNVQEFVQDWYQKDYYSSSPQTDPLCKNSNSNCNASRGGSWRDLAFVSRPYTRSALRSGNAGFHIGFRIVREY